MIICMFVIGWMSNSVYSSVTEGKEIPFSLMAEERASPSDWISEKDIRVTDEKITINIKNASWAKFTDTNSMDPVFDYLSNTIEIKPTNPNKIKAGDIISYKSDFDGSLIVHRVVETGFDTQGWYCRVKGDNNPIEDFETVRFSQVNGVVVAIIY